MKAVRQRWPCTPMPTPKGDAASCFVNPLTALAMVETMRLEGHTALVHTAAASNLGQMLVKICVKDGVDLVNIVRTASSRPRPAQEHRRQMRPSTARPRLPSWKT